WRTAEMSADVTHTPLSRMQDRDLFTLGKRQEARRQGSEADRAHATSFAKPTRPDRRRHAGRDTGFLTREPTSNRFPKPLPMLTPRHRWATRRSHCEPPRSSSCPPRWPPHIDTSSSRCCDDRLNSPNSPRGRSHGALSIPGCSLRWVPWVIASTTQ